MNDWLELLFIFKIFFPSSDLNLVDTKTVKQF